MSELGPLAPLEGNWEGNVGLDVSYHHDDGAIGETTYFEQETFTPTGATMNGDQTLYGLNYEMTAWRHGEEAMAPFHNEVGYVIWDAGNSQVIRCFAVPRGITILAGGNATADATTLTVDARIGDDHGSSRTRTCSSAPGPPRSPRPGRSVTTARSPTPRI